MSVVRSASWAVLAVVGLGGCNGVAAPLSPYVEFDPPLAQGNYALSSTACAAEPLRTGGTVYYACDCGGGANPRCVPGDDGTANQPNQGTDPSRPLRSFSKAMEVFGTMNAGDTVAFCKGGSFTQNVESHWSNTRCSAANPCIIRDYRPAWDSGSGPSAADMPIISSSGYERIFGFLSDGLPQRRQGGYRLLNLHLRGAGREMGIGIGDATADTSLCNLWIDGVRNGVQDDTESNKSRRTIVKGSKFTNILGMGVLLGGSGNVVADNQFDNVGSDIMRDHAIYLTAHRPVSEEVVSGNEIRHNVWDPVTKKCRSIAIVAHGFHERMLIDNNVIISNEGADGNCWGVALTYAPDRNYPFQGFAHAIVRRNRIYGTGSVGIAVDLCTYCLVENNLVVVDGDGSSGVEAIKAPVERGGREITIRNNTIHFTPSARAGNFRGIVSNYGADHLIANNAISWKGTGGTFICTELKASSLKVSHNGCSGSTIKSGPTEQISVLDDPRYVNPGNDPLRGDFKLSTGSPFVDAGDPSTAAQVDLTGKTRDGSPDIGAFEN